MAGENSNRRERTPKPTPTPDSAMVWFADAASVPDGTHLRHRREAEKEEEEVSVRIYSIPKREAPIIASSYYQPSTVSAGKVIIGSMLERSAKVRFHGQWGGNSRAGGSGWEGWRVVVVLGSGGGGKPNTEST